MSKKEQIRKRRSENDRRNDILRHRKKQNRVEYSFHAQKTRNLKMKYNQLSFNTSQGYQTLRNMLQMI